MKKNLKLTLIGALLATVLGIGLVGSTFSYFTDVDAQGGSYPIGSVNTEIREETDGYAVKKPSVENTGKTACYVRMRYSILQQGLVTVNVPAQGWTDGGDGWYYYENAVAPGESTTPLFDTVALEEGREAQDLAHLAISLYQEAVQSEITWNGTDYTDADEIWDLYEAGFLAASNNS